MYNLSDIKSIPCVDVARRYGSIQLKESHGKLWGKLRSYEKTSSFNIDPNKNIWYDFGIAKGGSNIDLLMEIQGITKEDAIRILAEDFGFEQEKQTGWRPPTDNQYREIGIQPERATMNFGFDLNKHTPEQLERWSEKYGMHVKDLAIKYPVIYNNMVNKIAMEGINLLRDIYYSRLKMLNDPTINEITKDFIKHTLKSDANELNKKVDLLQRATTDSKKTFTNLQVNYEKDILEAASKKAQEVVKASKTLTEDERIRDRVVNVYKKLFNFNQADYFTVEQAKALVDFNKAVSKVDNKFLTIEAIKKAYKVLGDNLDKLQTDYSSIVKAGEKFQGVKNSAEFADWQTKADRLKQDLTTVKELFTKCSTVIEGIRESTLAMKNDNAKQNVTEKVLETRRDLTL